MRLRLDRDSGVPVGTQLAWRLHAAIASGELRAGDKLPSLRDAADAAGVNVNTVRAAYAKLEAAGVVTTEQGKGTFVARSADEPDRRRGLLDEIARLETELVSLPLLPEPGVIEPPARAAGARLLSVDELEAVRDVLAERVNELHATRAAIVARLRQPVAEPEPEPEPEPARAPARRSTSSLSGALVRWT